MLKRGVDIALSAVLLIVSLPILALAALLIALDSRGPVLFSQVRVGRGFKPFTIWKLRTMRHRTSGPVHTMAADPRVTRTGGWLRWLKIDELPQLWNVLCGEMSLVGPRPVVPALALEFRPVYLNLLRVRPGITDPASVKYCSESELLGRVADQSRYFKTILVPDKLRISSAYLHHANLWSDLCVLAATAHALVLCWLHSRPGEPWIDATETRAIALYPIPAQTSGARKPPYSESAALPDTADLEQA